MPAPNVTHNGTLAGGPGLNVLQDDGKERAPTQVAATTFPAWAPSVAVALAMLIFLAASFYIRHKKVMKKRELLMDYFYIIFQYGGLRRKRMVAALCNTNAITLRELGRSFMISFDSVNNGENSCPFFLEDNTAFGGSQNFNTGNNAHKKTFFNRAMVNSRKYRIPFRRSATNGHVDENQATYPVSFHDILMKFKSKRSPPAPPGTPCMRPRSPSQYELQGSSMCTIHGDDFDYQKYMEENEVNSPVFYNRTRRNAYVPSPQPVPRHSSRFADLVTEAKRHSLGNVYHEHIMNDGKRNSEPFEHQGPRGVFQVYSEHLKPPGAAPSSRNLSEPTILVHSASSDWSNDGNGWTELPGPSGEGGVVFVRRLSRVDAGPGEYSYSHDSAPQLGLAKRANLSKVNVQSGNMNEYYNCLQRGTTLTQTTDKSPVNTSGENTPTQDSGPGPPRGRRGRMSLGEIAVSNLNRRIDLTSESLRDHYPEASERSKNRWARFKHVFSGSRPGSSKSSSIPSNHSSGKGKALVPPIVEERLKKRAGQQSRTRWQKFVKVFTGFRSLPEQNSTPQIQISLPTGSRSYPAGLNMQRGGSTCERSESIDLNPEEEEMGGLRLNIDTLGLSGEESVVNERTQRLKDDSPVSPDERSLRGDYSPARPGSRRFRSVLLAYRAAQPNTYTGSKRYRKKYDSPHSSSQSLPYMSRLDARTSSPFRRVYESSPLAQGIDKSREISSPGYQSADRNIDLESGATGFSGDTRHGQDPCSPRLQPCLYPRLANVSGPTSFTIPGHNDSSVPGALSTDVFVDLKSRHIKNGRARQLNMDSCSSSDSSTDQPSRSLLPVRDISAQRPDAVSLGHQSVTQSLLSPDQWQAGASCESIYYDTFSSPVTSPIPPRSFPEHRTLKEKESPARLNSNLPEQRKLKCQRVRHPLGSSDQRLENRSNRLASPDWRFLRRRSEELRPHTRSKDKAERRRSAISNASSIGSSLLTSTEVILVPMTISAPDSPVSSAPASPAIGANQAVHRFNQKPKLNSKVRPEPAPFIAPKPHQPIRLTLSCPNRSESDVTIAMPEEGGHSISCSPELRRKSDTVLSRFSNGSRSTTPTHPRLSTALLRTTSPSLVPAVQAASTQAPLGQGLVSSTRLDTTTTRGNVGHDKNFPTHNVSRSQGDRKLDGNFDTASLRMTSPSLVPAVPAASAQAPLCQGLVSSTGLDRSYTATARENVGHDKNFPTYNVSKGQGDRHFDGNLDSVIRNQDIRNVDRNLSTNCVSRKQDNCNFQSNPSRPIVRRSESMASSGRPARLRRQTSQDVKTLSPPGYFSAWGKCTQRPRSLQGNLVLDRNKFSQCFLLSTILIFTAEIRGERLLGFKI